jgi:hypothetical protein
MDTDGRSDSQTLHEDDSYNGDQATTASSWTYACAQHTKDAVRGSSAPISAAAGIDATAVLISNQWTCTPAAAIEIEVN